jgi:hypothetical protein
MEHHNERLTRIRALIDEVEAQQRAGRDIAVKMEELRREVTRALAPADSSDDKQRERR